MSVTLEVGKTYLMADGTQIRIGWVGGSERVPIFRISEDHPEYWFRTGSHMSGNEALRFIIEMPGSPIAPAPVAPAAPVAPVAPSAAPAPAPATVLQSDDVRRYTLEIDWNARTVRVVA